MEEEFRMQSDSGKLIPPVAQDAHWTGQPSYNEQPPPYYPAASKAPPGDWGYQGYYPPPGAPVMPQPVVCQPSNVVVVNTQPAVVTYGVRPKDYMCWSILNCLCCFWPLGLAAIICSCKSQSAADQNNMQEAASSSRSALTLNICSLVFGVLAYVVLFVYYYNVRH